MSSIREEPNLSSVFNSFSTYDGGRHRNYKKTLNLQNKENLIHQQLSLQVSGVSSFEEFHNNVISIGASCQSTFLSQFS